MWGEGHSYPEMWKTCYFVNHLKLFWWNDIHAYLSICVIYIYYLVYIHIAYTCMKSTTNKSQYIVIYTKYQWGVLIMEVTRVRSGTRSYLLPVDILFKQHPSCFTRAHPCPSPTSPSAILPLELPSPAMLFFLCSFCPWEEMNSFCLCPYSLWKILNLLLCLLVILFQDV